MGGTDQHWLSSAHAAFCFAVCASPRLWEQAYTWRNKKMFALLRDLAQLPVITTRGGHWNHYTRCRFWKLLRREPKQIIDLKIYIKFSSELFHELIALFYAGHTIAPLRPAPKTRFAHRLPMNALLVTFQTVDVSNAIYNRSRAQDW
jgi:hypothetical protein